uniref:ERCC4 domain-containing protein n=1 Tax=Arion vulgaris TaxID=1028688 RepID=A0A0B6ZG98_9EUPU
MSQLSQPSACVDIQKEVVAVLHAEDAVCMIISYIQRKQGLENEHVTLTEWVNSLQSAMPDKNLSVFIVGLSKYFSKQNTAAKQKYREAVTGQMSRGRKKKEPAAAKITTLDAEEAFVEIQLANGCVVQQVATDEELASQIKHFTKAVIEKHSKKDRFDNVFSFLNEGTSGLSVNKKGEGLSKVWKHQLMQLKNFGAEMADAVLSVYPSPSLLYEACQADSANRETEKLLSDINVRRHASVIATNRKIGKEHARRIYTFITSTNPDQIIK